MIIYFLLYFEFLGCAFVFVPVMIPNSMNKIAINLFCSLMMLRTAKLLLGYFCTAISV